MYLKILYFGHSLLSPHCIRIWLYSLHNSQISNDFAKNSLVFGTCYVKKMFLLNFCKRGQTFIEKYRNNAYHIVHQLHHYHRHSPIRRCTSVNEEII